MHQKLTAESISRALFHADPMHTCCLENDCYDEYDRVADDVMDRLNAGEPLSAALVGAIVYWFYDDDSDSVNDRVIQPVIEWLDEEGKAHE